jgi:hypothetical protein
MPRQFKVAILIGGTVMEKIRRKTPIRQRRRREV